MKVGCSFAMSPLLFGLGLDDDSPDNEFDLTPGICLAFDVVAETMAAAATDAANVMSSSSRLVGKTVDDEAAGKSKLA